MVYLQQPRDNESPQQSSDVEVPVEMDLKDFLKGEFQKVGKEFKCGGSPPCNRG